MGELWRNISEREQRLLVVGALFIVAALIYALVAHPLLVNYARYGRDIKKKELLLSWMRSSALEAKKLMATGNGEVVVTTGSPLGLIDRTSRRFALATALKRVEPVDNDGVKVWLEGASFTEIISWARVLDRKYAVRIDAAYFDTPQEPGHMNARLTFRRRGL